MKKIRTGNDIHIIWTITKNDAVAESSDPLDLSGAEVLLVDALKHAATFDYVINTIDDSTAQVVGTFFGKDQHTQGKYNLLLVKNRGEENMITLDYVDAFLLTCVSKFGVISGNDESSITTATIELDSDLVSYNGSPDMTLYYTKDEIDAMFGDYYTKLETYNKDEIDAGISAIEDAINTKANQSDLTAHTSNNNIHVTSGQKALWNSVRDKASEDEVTALRQYTSAFQREITDEVATKANASDVYTKSETYNKDEIDAGISAIEDAINTKANSSDVYTKSETYNKDEIDAGISAIEDAINTKANASDLTSHTGNSDIHVTTTDKANWNAKQDALFSVGASANSVKYIDNLGQNYANQNGAFALGRGCYVDGNSSFGFSGTINGGYNIQAVDNTLTTFYLWYKNVAQPTPSNIQTFANFFYYLGYTCNAFKNLKLYVNSGGLKYAGKITNPIFDDTTTPYRFKFTLDKTNAEYTISNQNVVAVITTTSTINDSYTINGGVFAHSCSNYSTSLGVANLVSTNNSSYGYNSILGAANTVYNSYSNVFGMLNCCRIPASGNYIGINNIFGILNDVQAQGTSVFGFMNKVRNYVDGNLSNMTPRNVVGSENEIWCKGNFYGAEITANRKTDSDIRDNIFGYAITSNDHNLNKVLLGQFNTINTLDNNVFELATGIDDNTRHNSIEVEYDSTNTTWTTKLKDTVSIGQIADIESTINGKQNALSYYVENSTDPILGLYRHAGVEKTINNTIIALNGIAGTNSTSGTMVGNMLLDMSNLLGITNMIDNTGVHLIYTVGQSDTILDVNSNGVVVTTPTGKTFTYNGNEVATVDKAVTSSTSNLKIEVVSAMPATPNANTIYIVV